jgi:hypothetical protein
MFVSEKAANLRVSILQPFDSPFGQAIHLQSIGFYFVGLRASKLLFQNLLTSIMRAPMSFFDTTVTVVFVTHPALRLLESFTRRMTIP